MDKVVYLFKIRTFLKSNGPELLFKMDETFWRFVNGNFNVIGITGSENRKVVSNLTGKEGFTAVFLISANGVFHKTSIILKGKTPQSLNKEIVNNNNQVNLMYNISRSVEQCICHDSSSLANL